MKLFNNAALQDLTGQILRAKWVHFGGLQKKNYSCFFHDVSSWEKGLFGPQCITRRCNCNCPRCLHSPQKTNLIYTSALSWAYNFFCRRRSGAWRTSGEDGGHDSRFWSLSCGKEKKQKTQHNAICSPSTTGDKRLEERFVVSHTRHLAAMSLMMTAAALQASLPSACSAIEVINAIIKYAGRVRVCTSIVTQAWLSLQRKRVET